MHPYTAMRGYPSKWLHLDCVVIPCALRVHPKSISAPKRRSSSVVVLKYGLFGDKRLERVRGWWFRGNMKGSLCLACLANKVTIAIDFTWLDVRTLYLHNSRNQETWPPPHARSVARSTHREQRNLFEPHQHDMRYRYLCAQTIYSVNTIYIDVCKTHAIIWGRFQGETKSRSTSPHVCCDIVHVCVFDCRMRHRRIDPVNMIRTYFGVYKVGLHRGAKRLIFNGAFKYVENHIGICADTWPNLWWWFLNEDNRKVRLQCY